MVDRIDFRAFDPAPAGEAALENERRFRAAVERAFSVADNALDAIGEGTGSGCCGNIDGGHPDSIYGGIFCSPVDGGGV